MMQRVLRVLTLFPTDGAPGLMATVQQAWPNSLRQRCLAHKKRNTLGKSPDMARKEVKPALSAAYKAPNPHVADMLTVGFISRYRDLHPSVISCLQDDVEGRLPFLNCPAIHHRSMRTTKLLERAFLEQRRCTRTISIFFHERSYLKLVFATLWRASERWTKVRTSEIQWKQLDHLRRELKLEKAHLITREPLEAAG